MEPEYVAKKSAWRAFSSLLILLIWLIIPIFIIIVRAIILKHEYIEFYADKVIQRSGVIAKHEKRAAFTGVTGVSIEQGIMGRICNYGDVHIDIPGKWDITTDGIKDPKELQSYLESRLVQLNATVYNTMG